VPKHQKCFAAEPSPFETFDVFAQIHQRHVESENQGNKNLSPNSSHSTGEQGCQIFLGTVYAPKWGKINQITSIFTIWP
jgi:hypothetical protein